MTDTITKLIDDLIIREGGYVDHAADRGGPTKFGITLKTLGLFYKMPVTAEDVRDLPIESARSIYRKNYFDDVGLDLIEVGSVQRAMLDFAVLHGPYLAVRRLQATVDVVVDGQLGPITAAATNALDPRAVVNALAVARLKHVAQIVSANTGQAVFLKGWINRITDFIR